MLITNTKLDVIEVMKKYKELSKIETAFKELKHFVEIRPIYHWKERRVKAPVFVCVLAFLTEMLIERATKLSARKAIRILKRIKINQHNVDEEKINIVDRLLDEEISLLNELQIEMPQRIY